MGEADGDLIVEMRPFELREQYSSQRLRALDLARIRRALAEAYRNAKAVIGPARLSVLPEMHAI